MVRRTFSQFILRRTVVVLYEVVVRERPFVTPPFCYSRPLHGWLRSAQRPEEPLKTMS